MLPWSSHPAVLPGEGNRRLHAAKPLPGQRRLPLRHVAAARPQDRPHQLPRHRHPIAAPQHAYPYDQQWNAKVKHMFGNSSIMDLAYIGAPGVHLPLFGVNYDQLPDQYLQGIDPKTGLDANGNGPAKLVNNPFYGIIPASYG